MIFFTNRHPKCIYLVVLPFRFWDGPIRMRKMIYNSMRLTEIWMVFVCCAVVFCFKVERKKLLVEKSEWNECVWVQCWYDWSKCLIEHIYRNISEMKRHLDWTKTENQSQRMWNWTEKSSRLLRCSVPFDNCMIYVVVVFFSLIFYFLIFFPLKTIYH